MGESLIQPSRVQEDCPMGCKLLLYRKKTPNALGTDGTVRISIGQLRASSRGNTEGASVIRIHWVQRVRRRACKSVVKSYRLTVELPLKLQVLSMVEVSGMQHVAVKCIDMLQNTDSEGSLPVHH
eukprot:TRINITY_DN84_c0_g1_i11.p2 TRINITY_DN84_c0_g1~~TRINITY_DN84_c0_g1_i11.p2  ORF type:complete len:125 (+),score=7.19 TRINITY_DN84_c0_g1_i11:477-851(+)